MVVSNTESHGLQPAREVQGASDRLRHLGDHLDGHARTGGLGVLVMAAERAGRSEHSGVMRHRHPVDGDHIEAHVDVGRIVLTQPTGCEAPYL